MESAREIIIQKKIIAIIRGSFDLGRLHEMASALLKGGVMVMEVTLNSTDALASITSLRKSFGNQLLIGAGTVRTAHDTKMAIDAGAQFLISPNFDPASIDVSSTANILHLPGVFTATEIQHAHSAGCTMVKLFPADALGPRYIKALKAPIDDVDIVPTGGIDERNISDYLEAGAVAFGIGSALVKGPDQDLKVLQDRAKTLTQAVETRR